MFVCARNRWRSPTAEQLYRNDPRVEVRSAGVSSGARRRLSVDDLDWADLVLVMERTHRQRIIEHFSAATTLPPVEVLDIPDDYPFMDPELIELLRTGVEPWINRDQNHPRDR